MRPEAFLVRRIAPPKQGQDRRGENGKGLPSPRTAVITNTNEMSNF